MTRPRVSIGQLMAIEVFLGFGFAALKKNDKKLAEIAHLKAKLRQMENDYGHNKDQRTTIIRELRDRAERPGNTFGELGVGELGVWGARGPGSSGSERGARS
jgi:hypothetical protein